MVIYIHIRALISFTPATPEQAFKAAARHRFSIPVSSACPSSAKPMAGEVADRHAQ
jgi:hypothetical protein